MKHFVGAAAVTAGFGVCLTLAAVSGSPAAPGTAHKKAAPKVTSASSAKLVAQGKALVSAKKCNSCHGADLKGKQGFSPSLHASGVLHQYNAKTFARVMSTGVTEDGGKVKKPMPVYHLPAKDSAALYAYLKTLK